MSDYYARWDEWRFRLEHFADPSQDGYPDALPPVPQPCLDAAYELMEEAENRGVDDKLSVGWEEDGIDIELRGIPRGKSVSIIVAYADEWDEELPHEVMYIPYHLVFTLSPGKINSWHPETPAPTTDPGEALDWIMSV